MKAAAPPARPDAVATPERHAGAPVTPVASPADDVTHYIVGFHPPGMVVGFVLITTAPGKEHEVYIALQGIKEIVEMHGLFGDYDIIAKIDSSDFDSLGRIVVDRIRGVPGVADTKTLPGLAMS